MIPASVLDKIGRNLHNKENHPLCIMKNMIQEYFQTVADFEIYDDLSPVVTTIDNFDKLLIPIGHPARSKSDTYYLDTSDNNSKVLRTHTSAHQNHLLEHGKRNFLVTGDVYRKDEVDQQHYPVFHQMEGVAVCPDGLDPAEYLLDILKGLVNYLFPESKVNTASDYFPFTKPSYEIEVFHKGRWFEILGCGVVHEQIRQRNNCNDELVAWGLGLERLCMILFDIPDIRMFWNDDERFLSQFDQNRKISEMQFKPYSQLDPIERDISFFIGDEEVWKDRNDFFEQVREIGKDNIESITCYDSFFHKKKKMWSNSYRIKFTAPIDMDDPAKLTLFANETMKIIREKTKTNMNIILR